MKNKIFQNITICCVEKTFSFTPDEARVEDLVKASVLRIIYSVTEKIRP